MIHYERAPNVLWRATAHTVVLLPQGEREPLSLTGSAILLWELLEEPIAIEHVVGLLAEHYGIGREEVSVAIAPFLADLTDRKAITMHEVA